MRGAHLLEYARVYADEETCIVVLDRSGPKVKSEKDPDRMVSFQPNRQRSVLAGKRPRFTITRTGKFKFAKKITVRDVRERVYETDEDGNRVPDPFYGSRDDEGNYHGSRYKYEVVEREEPEADASYEIDRHWNGLRSVTVKL